MSRRAFAIAALLVGCSGGQSDVDVAEPTGEPLASAEPAGAEPTATATTAPVPSSTGVNAIGKIGKICTQIGCRDQLIVDAPNAKLAPGLYLLTIEADGKSASCPLEITAKEPTTKGCVGALAVKLAFPGNVPVAGAEGGYSLVFDSAPASVTVRMTSSAQKKLGEQTLTPTYKTFQPNGPDCSPTCKQGKETLQLK